MFWALLDFYAMGAAGSGAKRYFSNRNVRIERETMRSESEMMDLILRWTRQDHRVRAVVIKGRA